MLRLRNWILVLLLLGAVARPFLHAELSEEEKRKRALFLKAREEMRTVSPTPSPSVHRKHKAKPKPAKHPPRKKKSTRPKAKATPEPEETPRHKAKRNPKKEAEEEKEEEETPRPKATVTRERERESPPPRASAAPARATHPADVVVEKSGFQETEEILPEPTPEEHHFLFFKWRDKSATRYRYLSRSVRAQIDRAHVLRHRWQYIVVHNSGTRQGNARIFDYYHKHVRHMTNGLAYHFVIGNGTSSGNGEIEIGDRWRRQINGGHVHSDYLNNIALGICLVGDFNRDQPTRAELGACEELIRYLRVRCGKINGHYAIVRPHREMNPPRWPTDCPGDDFPYKWFRRFRE